MTCTLHKYIFYQDIPTFLIIFNLCVNSYPISIVVYYHIFLSYIFSSLYLLYIHCIYNMLYNLFIFIIVFYLNSHHLTLLLSPFFLCLLPFPGMFYPISSISLIQKIVILIYFFVKEYITGFNFMNR